jgi:magnesium chelatase subunit I
VKAQKKLSTVELSDEAIHATARLCVALAVDGHRGELTLCRAAVALAALEGRQRAAAGDIARVAVLALQHRLRKDPLESVDEDVRVHRAVTELFELG